MSDSIPEPADVRSAIRCVERAIRSGMQVYRRELRRDWWDVARQRYYTGSTMRRALRRAMIEDAARAMVRRLRVMLRATGVEGAHADQSR